MKRKIFLATAVILVMNASSVFAGFEWHPPKAPVSPVAKASKPEAAPSSPAVLGTGPAVSAAPVSPVVTDALSPVIDWQPLPSSPAPVAASEPAISDADKTPGDVVEGFGDGVTLVMALRDIAPLDYRFAFNKNIDLAALVDWQGGRPWKDVMNDVLASQNLKASIDSGKMITIAPAAVSAPVMTEAAPAPVAAPAQPSPADDKVMAEMSKSAAAPAPAVKPVVSEPAVGEKPLNIMAWVKQGLSSSNKEESVAPPPPVQEMTAAMPQEAAPVPVQEVPSVEPQLMAPSTATVAPAITSTSGASWRVQKGAFLRDVLEEWATRAGIRLQWMTDYDYHAPKDATFSGTFEEAVAVFLDSFQKSTPRPYGKLHVDDSGKPAVLVVRTN